MRLSHSLFLINVRGMCAVFLRCLKIFNTAKVTFDFMVTMAAACIREL